MNKPERRSAISDRAMSKRIDTITRGISEQPERQRKTRKDATGRKSDYHQGTSTLAVRLPDQIADQVRTYASSEGISVNAWLASVIRAELKKRKP